MIWKLCGIIALCLLSYLLGASQCKVKVAEKKISSIKYVETCRSEIYSKPCKNKSQLLELMKAGKL